MRSSISALFVGLALSLTSTIGCHHSSSSAEVVNKGPAWELLASELPQALLSVSGRSPKDIFTVGADKGEGPLVLHFDGEKWAELHTGQRGDLWWVQAMPNGPVLLSGAGGMVLSYDGKTFSRLDTPAATKEIVYGVWGKSNTDIYGVGNTAGHDGFIWHSSDGKKFIKEDLPPDLTPKGTEAPGFYKVWGKDDEVWVVGSRGTILHRKGSEPWKRVETPTKEAIFTIHGDGNRVVAVGGSGNGVILRGAVGSLKDASPPGAGLVQGVFVSDAPTIGDWASGERGFVYHADPGGAFKIMDHGLQLPAASSLHSIYVDSAGGVWSAGGNVLTTALDNGMLIHYGDQVPPVSIDEDETPPKKN